MANLVDNLANQIPGGKIGRKWPFTSTAEAGTLEICHFVHQTYHSVHCQTAHQKKK
jgi:hypothetical protein